MAGKNKFGWLSIVCFVIFAVSYFHPAEYPDEPLSLYKRIIGMIPLLLNLAGFVFGVLAINKENKILGFVGFILNVLLAFLWLSFFFSFGPGAYLLEFFSELFSILAAR